MDALYSLLHGVLFMVLLAIAALIVTGVIYLLGPIWTTVAIFLTLCWALGDTIRNSK